MPEETYKHFKYEIALGEPFPMPKPPINYYPNMQYSVQQFLHTLCKKHVGSLGKRGGKWEFGEDAPKDARLGNRPDIIQIFDYAEKMGVIVPDSGADTASPESFIPYKLADAYQTKFDKFVL